MHFRLMYSVRAMTVPAGSLYTFKYGGPHSIRVELRSPTDDEEREHHMKTAVCAAFSEMEPNERNRAVFQQIETNQVLSADADCATAYRGPAGSEIRLPRLETFPGHYRTFIEQTELELADFARRTVGVLRWRMNLDGPHDALANIGFGGLHWSSDQQFWHWAPRGGRTSVKYLPPARPTDEVIGEVRQSVAAGEGEPLDHVMFREAWSQQYTNPRSALVIGMASAELSVKRCISTLVPDAEWLATNVPMPPLVNVLRDYVPKLPARNSFNGAVKGPPESLINTLKKGVLLRNQVAHAGAGPPEAASLNEVLLAVSDVLWLLDYYGGNVWATAHIRQEALNALANA